MYFVQRCRVGWCYMKKYPPSWGNIVESCSISMVHCLDPSCLVPNQCHKYKGAAALWLLSGTAPSVASTVVQPDSFEQNTLTVVWT